MHSRFRAFRAAGSIVLLAPTIALAQVPSSLLNEGDPFPEAGPGAVIQFLNNTAVNHAGGYAIGLSSDDGTSVLSHVWGHPNGGPGMILRTEGTFGPLVQTSFESFYGMANDGSIAYSASGTGGPVGNFDSVWRDDNPIAVEGDPYPHLAGWFWRFASRPGISGNSIPYFVGGITSTQGGATQNRGLFAGDTGAPEFIGGDLLPGLPAALGTGTTVSFDVRYSELGNHYLAEVQMDLPTAQDGAMVLDGAGLLMGGSLVQEGTVVPPAAGGINGEAWAAFDFCGVNEAGDWMFTGDTNGDTGKDEFIAKNGMIVVREGDLVDGEILAGSIEGAYLNADGDFAYTWDIQGGTLEALFLNDMLVLKEGDTVDFDGDGFVDPGAHLVDFTGISALTLSDRSLNGEVRLYFTADIDTAGTSSTLDDVEGFYCLPVNLGPVSVTFSSLSAQPALRSQSIVVQWATSNELDHAGFHVYRSRLANGTYDRLTDELVVGQSPYSYLDPNVQRNTVYYYRIGAVDTRGHEQLSDPIEVRTPMWGVRTALIGNAPNPFTKKTEISFALEREGQATITIFDVAGRKVRTLVNADLPAGEHSVTWDGRTDDGRFAAGGVFFYRLDSGDRSVTRKMVQLVER
ncbi:MAG: T9SS type A sorting domain-containing protein [Gemmatimonadetes bacterium]|nr:T9SS type A sorting domain-containing protein [Gemmatimonadota bacterium]